MQKIIENRDFLLEINRGSILEIEGGILVMPVKLAVGPSRFNNNPYGLKDDEWPLLAIFRKEELRSDTKPDQGAKLKPKRLWTIQKPSLDELKTEVLDIAKEIREKSIIINPTNILEEMLGRYSKTRVDYLRDRDNQELRGFVVIGTPVKNNS